MKQLAGSAGSNYGPNDIRVALRMILWTCRFNNIKENEVLLLLVHPSASFWRHKKPANNSQHDIIMKSDHLLIRDYYTEGLSRCTVNLYAQLQRGFHSAQGWSEVPLDLHVCLTHKSTLLRKEQNILAGGVVNNLVT